MILKSDGQVPQPAWLAFVVTGKARASIRRFVRNKDRAETIARADTAGLFLMGLPTA